jgi:hypothetical protein
MAPQRAFESGRTITATLLNLQIGLLPREGIETLVQFTAGASEGRGRDAHY